MQKISEILMQLTGQLKDLLKVISLTRRETKIRVTQTLKGSEEDQENILSVKTFVTSPATVGVKLGRTINLGNFEYARIDVDVSVPCYVEEIAEVYAKTMQIAEFMIQEKVKEINGKTRTDDI